MPTVVHSVTVSGNLGGQFVQNVMHVHSAAAATRSAFAESDDIMRTLIDTYSWWSVWLSALPTSYRAASMRVRRIFPIHGATTIELAPTGGSGLGARSGEISSQQVAPVIDLFNETDARRIGKIFMPGISETDISQGTYTSAYVGIFDLNYRNFLNQTFTMDLSSDDFKFCIYNKLKVPSFLEISDVRLSPLIGTQRRRLRPYA